MMAIGDAPADYGILLQTDAAVARSVERILTLSVVTSSVVYRRVCTV